MAFFARMREFRTEARIEFYSHIAPLLSNSRVRELDNYTQHRNYTRLRHSVDVAYYSFLITKFLNWDSRSVARAGLLHDMYYSGDYSEGAWQHLVNHPAEALENARSVCALNEVEEDIILKHMWLCTITPPKYKEGFVVTFVDKFCAIREASAVYFTGRITSTIYDQAPVPVMVHSQYGNFNE